MNEPRPNETETQRADRNFNELLQELRVTQTGVQVLFGFLLTMPLQARYRDLDQWERGLLVGAILSLALATVCIIAPVAWHRVLFRRRMKDQVVNVASVLAQAGLTALAIGILMSIALALDLIVPRWAALLASAVMLAVIASLWLILPLLRRRDTV